MSASRSKKALIRPLTSLSVGCTLGCTLELLSKAAERQKQQEKPAIEVEARAANISVNDLERVCDFYGTVLGLEGLPFPSPFAAPGFPWDRYELHVTEDNPIGPRLSQSGSKAYKRPSTSIALHTLDSVRAGTPPFFERRRSFLRGGTNR